MVAMAGTVEVRQDGHFDAEKILSKRSVPCRGKEPSIKFNEDMSVDYSSLPYVLSQLWLLHHVIHL